MKKMTLSKAKNYAQKIYKLELKLRDIKETDSVIQITTEIQNIVDEICENFEPVAMYKVDEQVYEIEKKNKRQDK